MDPRSVSVSVLFHSPSQNAQYTRPSPAATNPSNTPSQRGRARGKDTNTSPSPQSRTGGSADTPPLQARGRGRGGTDPFTLFQQHNLLNQYAFAGVVQPPGIVGDRDKTEMEGSSPLLAMHPWHAAYITYLAWTMQQRWVNPLAWTTVGPTAYRVACTVPHLSTMCIAVAVPVLDYSSSC